MGQIQSVLGVNAVFSLDVSNVAVLVSEDGEGSGAFTGLDLNAALQYVFGIGQRQLGTTAAEQLGEGLIEFDVDLLKGGGEGGGNSQDMTEAAMDTLFEKLFPQKNL